MYFKIAVKNVRKNFNDYTIYFMTLVLAIGVFYSFNSIDSQKVFIEAMASKKNYIFTLTKIIYVVSIFIAFFLGILILYANNFLIKKRYKEFKIYVTLGMSKSKISKIMIIETAIIGVAALVTGLVLGLVTSQALSVLTAKLFEFGINDYSFLVSYDAIVKTIIYFTIILLLVMMFNTYLISKYKVIEIAKKSKRYKEADFKNPVIYLFAFILCIAALDISYRMIFNIRFDSLKNSSFYLSITLAIIGTVLFFYSVTGFILYVAKKNKKLYFKGINIFTVKQINSKINSNFVSMSIICIMMSITICVLSTGFSVKKSIESSLKVSTPFDFSGIMYGSGSKSIKKAFKAMNIKFNDDDKVVYYDVYKSNLLITDIIDLETKDIVNPVLFIKISDYNKIRELNGEKPVTLKNNEVLISSDVSMIVPYIEKYMKNNEYVKLNDKIYKIHDNHLIENNLRNSFIKDNYLTIIINDNYCNTLNPLFNVVDVNFGHDSSKRAGNLTNMIESSEHNIKIYKNVGYVKSRSRQNIYENNKGIVIIGLFIGIYLGIIFLISSMAILAIQQLSEASDNAERYVALRRIGADMKSINKSIFRQTLIYFTLPVILTISHSIVGISVINNYVSKCGEHEIVYTSLLTAGMFMLIYIIYFYITYSGYKNIIKSKIK